MSGATTGWEAAAVAVRSGACLASALTVSADSVGDACRQVRSIALQLGFTTALAEDLASITSQLATSGLRRGGDRVTYRAGRPVAGLPELWLYLRGHRRPELVVTVFDAGTFGAFTAQAPAGRRNFFDVHLASIAARVHAAGGRWGAHPSRSRLGAPRLQGTAVWVAVPAPTDVRVRVPSVPTPYEAISRLTELLRVRGLGDLLSRATDHEALLSLPMLTVWFRQGSYFWEGSAGPVRANAADVVDVAEQLLAEHERIPRTRDLTNAHDSGRCGTPPPAPP